jgi:hypothetical protein
MSYGFEVYNSSGVKTLEVSSRVPRLVSVGGVTITMEPSLGSYSASPITVPGITPSDDSYLVLLNVRTNPASQLSYSYTVNTNSITFTVDKVETSSATTTTVYYYILRN